MVYRYNKGIYIHIIIEIAIFLVLNALHGIFLAIIGIAISLLLTTVVLNCYKVEVNNEKILIYQIYGGCTAFKWDEIDTIEIGKDKIEIPIIGAVKNLTIKLHLQQKFEVNIEPVERDEMIEHIEKICTTKGIHFSK